MSENKTPCFIVFAGKDRKNAHSYYKIDSLSQNNGKSVEEQECRLMCFSKSLFDSKAVGGIYAAEMSEDGKTMHSNKREQPAGYWSNQNDKAKWQLANKAATNFLSEKRKGSENAYEKILEPIRDAYAEGDSTERSLILAEVIRFITRTTYR